MLADAGPPVPPSTVADNRTDHPEEQPQDRNADQDPEGTLQIPADRGGHCRGDKEDHFRGE